MSGPPNPFPGQSNTTVDRTKSPRLSLGRSVDWNKLTQSIVFIAARDRPSSDRGFCRGSGTVVLNGDYVLTNAHVVVNEAGRPRYALAIGFTSSFEAVPSRWVSAELHYADIGLDLAVLKLRERHPAVKSIKVTSQHPEPGKSITILGYPGVGGMTMTLVKGVYSGMLDFKDEPHIKTDADFSFGHSGGAAFDDAGVFIGVPTRIRGEVGLLVPAKSAMLFLERFLAASAARRQTAGMPGKPSAAQRWQAARTREILEGAVRLSQQSVEAVRSSQLTGEAFRSSRRSIEALGNAGRQGAERAVGKALPDVRRRLLGAAEGVSRRVRKKH